MKTLRIAIFVLFLPMLVSAQNKKDMKENSEMRVEKTANKQTNWMKKNLSLNYDQMEDVEEINYKYVEKREEVLMNDGTIKDKQKALEENWNEQTRELKDVLTDEQFAKLEIQKQKWTDKTSNRLNNTHYQKDKGVKEKNDQMEY